MAPRDLLRRHWFLACLSVGLLMVWLWPSSLRPWLGFVKPRVVVSMALFLMAWGLESSRLGSALARPGPMLLAVAVSYGLVPLLAVLLGQVLATPDLRIGLILIASVPCTLASAVLFTRLGGGNEATALLVVMLTTALSWLVTSSWLAGATAMAVEIQATDLMLNLALVLIVPVGLGQASRTLSLLRRTAARWRSPLGVISQLLVLGMVLKAAVEARDQVAATQTPISLETISIAVVVCLGVHLAGLAAGMVSSRLFRFEQTEHLAVGFSGSQKSLPVGMYLFQTYYVSAYPLAVVPLLLYHVGQLFVDSFLANRLAVREAAQVETSSGI